MKLKGLHFVDVAEIQEAITDELMKVQKRGIFGSFSETLQLRKAYIYASGAFLNKEKGTCPFHVSSVFKKILS
jgi:hypothetical protein